MSELLTSYLHTSYLVLPLLAALWGMVALRTMQLYQPELALVRRSVREILVVRSVGRPWWRRMYDEWLLAGKEWHMPTIHGLSANRGLTPKLSGLGRTISATKRMC